MSAAAASPQSPKDQSIAAVREDLVLSPGPVGPDGEATWRIYDPLRHRFVAIDATARCALELLRVHNSTSALTVALSKRLLRRFDIAEVEGLVTFLRQSNLLQDTGEGDWRRRWASEVALRHGVVMQLVHNYLFFRVPLYAPERFLDASAQAVAIFFNRRLHFAILILGAIGLYLVSRQWDVFLSDARGMLTATGLAQFGVTLIFVKILHEFGHAYSARRFGCRVPVMGIAFMMMAPVLYTDVTDAWRLKNWRERFAIDIAGVAVEIGIACIATFLWVFLPDGTFRQMCFLLATTSWVMSVAINLNPLMRFDGYYIASDLLGVENLQSRSFALGIWRMREWLFGLGRPSPETELTSKRVRVLIAYAWSIWLYRLIMFTGIALMVYAYFFKALGIILFLFEIGYFIVKPIAAELKDWWRMRVEILKSKRTMITGSLLFVTCLAIVVPWSSTVRAPAVLESQDTAKIYAIRPAQVVGIDARQGAVVRAGDILLRLESPELESERRIAQSKLASIDLRLARTSADKDDLNDRQVLISNRVALVAKLEGIYRERAELVVRSPGDGVLAELNPALHPGRWIGAREQLALVRGTDRLSLVGYLREADLWRVEPGATAVFIPELPLASRTAARLTRVSNASATEIEQQELTQPNGGTIDVQNDGRSGRLVPTAAHYQLALVAEVGGALPNMRLRGVVLIEGQSESILSLCWRHVLKVLVRESAA